MAMTQNPRLMMKDSSLGQQRYPQNNIVPYGMRFSTKLNQAERALARDILRHQSRADQFKTLALMKRSGALEMQPPFARTRERIVTGLNKRAGGRRLVRYLDDPETQQFIRDVAVLGGLYAAVRHLPKVKRRVYATQKGDPLADIMNEAQNPSRYQRFARVFDARKRGARHFMGGLKRAWKAAL